jgi:hypothetical protein
MLKVCVIKDCNNQQIARGWCQLHYDRWRKNGTTDTIRNFLTDCKVDGCKQKHYSHGFCNTHVTQIKRGIEPFLFNQCKFCGQNITDEPMLQKLHKKCQKLHKRNSYFLRTYGITTQEYESLAAFQHNKCAICHEGTLADLQVDHDHFTNSVRGLLCGNCNRSLGLLKDDIYRLRNAQKYLTIPPMVIKRVYELTNHDLRQ